MKILSDETQVGAGFPWAGWNVFWWCADDLIAHPILERGALIGCSTAKSGCYIGVMCVPV